MRRRSSQLREQGVDVRTLADQLVAQTEGIAWTGRAAEAMRERVRGRADHLRATASQHDTAADALDKHANEVEQRKSAISEIEGKAESLVTDARARVTQVESYGQADQTADRDDDDDSMALVEFSPPPPGHKDWLTVNLPGLRTTP